MESTGSSRKDRLSKSRRLKVLSARPLVVVAVVRAAAAEDDDADDMVLLNDDGESAKLLQVTLVGFFAVVVVWKGKRRDEGESNRLGRGGIARTIQPQYVASVVDEKQNGLGSQSMYCRVLATLLQHFFYVVSEAKLVFRQIHQNWQNITSEPCYYLAGEQL